MSPSQTHLLEKLLTGSPISKVSDNFIEFQAPE